MSRFLISLILILSVMPLKNGLTQTARFTDYKILNGYIKDGLKNNLALKQKQFAFQKSIQALKEARGMFLPSVSIEARYSRAGGGRTIEFPVGDMMNPVYQSLNEIFTAMGQPPKPFPVLENESIHFLREEEHDTKIRAVQPVFQPVIYYNYKIKTKMNDMSRFEVDVYKRALIADIKKAYFNYLKTDYLVGVIKETLELLHENLRVSKALHENQKITKDGVYRSRAELSKVEQQLVEIENSRETAQFYFNFLLNRPLDLKIEPAADFEVDQAVNADLESAWAVALKNREELSQLEKAVEIAGYSKKIASSGFLPGISVVGDYGFEGEQYNFDKDHDYWMVSGVLQWNLFRGFQDEAKSQQAEIEKKRLQTKRKELENLVRLQVQQAMNNLIAAKKSISTAKVRRRSAEESFKITEKKYREGMAVLVEYLDARTTLTRARVNEILTYHDFLRGKAELEKVTASLSLEKTDK